MSATATTTKVVLTLRLNNGSTSTGAVKTVGQTLGAINKDTMDIDKAYAIARLCAPCLSKSIYSLEQTVVSVISEAA